MRKAGEEGGEDYHCIRLCDEEVTSSTSPLTKGKRGRVRLQQFIEFDNLSPYFVLGYRAYRT